MANRIDFDTVILKKVTGGYEEYIVKSYNGVKWETIEIFYNYQDAVSFIENGMIGDGEIVYRTKLNK